MENDGEGIPIGGRVDPAFAPVRDAFLANFRDHDELGAAVTVILAGETVVDLWGGFADERRTRPWRADTLVNGYSLSKPVIASMVLSLVQSGQIGLDDPVAAHWAEFGASGKQDATVRHALCHRAGVPAVREPLTDADLWEFDRMCTAVAATEPWWTPGERHAYHTNTYGHLLGGLLAAATGRSPGALLADWARQFDLDWHLGLPREHHHRCAEIRWHGPDPSTIDPRRHDGLDDETRMVLLGYVNPPGYASMGVVNTAEWRCAQVPSTNSQVTARAVARWYDAVRRGEILDPELLTEATRAQSTGHCPVLGQEVTFGLGFQPWTPGRPFGRTPAGFGHFGTGGSLGFADPSMELAFGYVMNDVVPRWQSPRNRALVDAVHSCLTTNR